MAGTRVDVRSLDEEIRQSRGVSDAADLGPEPALAERAVEVCTVFRSTSTPPEIR